MGSLGACLGPLGAPPCDAKEAARRAFWEGLGLTCDRLGPTWDHFRIVSRSFWDHLGIILGSCGDHLGVTFSIFQNSVLELKLQLYGPQGVETYADVKILNHGSSF